MNLPPLRDDASTRAGSVADRSRVSSVAEQIHNSYARASLLRQAEEKKARKVRFYRNGDKFYRGAVFAVSPERFRTFDSLLAELTRSPICDPKLMPNGVRYVFSLDGSRKILSLDELQEGESYVCATLDVFKDIDYTKTLSPTAWHQSSRAVRSGAASAQLLQPQQQTPPQTELPPLAGAPRRHTPPALGSTSAAAGLVAEGDAAGSPAADEAAFVECIKPRLITVVRSGPRPRMSVRIPLNKRAARSLEQVLRGVSDIIRLDSGSVRRMYALSGRQVHCLADFFLEDTIFLAFGNERPSSDDFHLDTNEVRLVCAYRFSASTKADRVTLRSQSSARLRPSRQFDNAATDQWSLQMRSQPTSPMVTRRQPRAAASDVRPRLAEERADSPTLIRRQPSVQGGNRSPQQVQPAWNSSSEANSALLHRSAHALTPSAAEAATEVAETAALETVNTNNGVQTADGDAKMPAEQKLDQTMSNTAATDSEPRYYDDESDGRNDVSENVAAGNARSPDAGSQMSHAAADAASTATARTDEGGESLLLDDDEHDLSSGDGSGVYDFLEPSAGGSVLSRISTGGSDNGGQSLDLQADGEGSGAEQPSDLDTKDTGKTLSNDDQGSEPITEEQRPLPQRSQQQERDQQPLPQPPRPELPQTQRRPHRPQANGHVVRDMRPEVDDERRADGDSIPEARRASGTLNEPSLSLGNSTSSPFNVATSTTVEGAAAKSSNLDGPSMNRQLTLPNASSSLQPEVAAATHDLENKISAESAVFVPFSDEHTSDAAKEEHSLENKLTVNTGAAFDVAAAEDQLASDVAPTSTGAAADHLTVEHAPISVDSANVKAQVAADQSKVASDVATLNDTEVDSFVEVAEGTAVVASRKADDVASGAVGVGARNQLQDASDAEAVAAVTMAADSQADENAHFVDTTAKGNEAEVATNHKAMVSGSKVAADGLQNGVAAEATAAATAGTDRSEIEIDSGAVANDRREHESAAKTAVAVAIAPDNSSEEIVHHAYAGVTPFAEIAHGATEVNRLENQAAPGAYTTIAETASDAGDEQVPEISALLEKDSENKVEPEGSSGPESTASGHDVEVVPTDADSPAAKDNGVTDVELSGVSDDARRERIEHRVEGDDEGDQLVFGRYQILRTIADEGSLTIKECVSRDTGRTLALKVVSKSSSTPEELQAISEEARLLRDVNHMNIIGLVDSFETRKAWYLVTDLDEGLDVVSAILTAETYSEAEAASLFGDLLNALKYLHSQNVVHGSVCIDKLLVVAAPSQSAQAAPMSTGWRLKLGGFSFAATADEAVAASSETEGARYDKDTRVELASSAEGTRRHISTIADLVAAGEVLWTLLTGRATPVDNRLRQVDIIEEATKLGVSQEAKNLLNALLEAGTISGLHTAEEALSHSWFARVTATPDATLTKYHEDRKEAIAINARASFVHKKKYSTKSAAINILKTSILSEDLKFASEKKIEATSRDGDNRPLMTDSDSTDKPTSASATEETTLTTSASNAFSVDATYTGDAHQLALASPIASNEKSRQSESQTFPLTATRNGPAGANRKNETYGAAASQNGVAGANRPESSTAPKVEQASAAQHAADVQQAIDGEVDGHIEEAPHDALEERRSELSKPVGVTFEDEDEYF